MKRYTVYNVDFLHQKREPIGMVLERRKEDRGNNVESLLKLAKKKYSTSPSGSHIYIFPE